MTWPLGTCISASQTLIWNGPPIRCSRVSPPPAKAAATQAASRSGASTKPARGQRRAQVGHRRVAAGLGGEGEAAEAAVGAHRQRRAEGGVEPAPGDLQPLAAAGVLAGAHRLPAQEEIVQPPRAGEAAGVRGVEHAVPLGEQPLGVVEREILLVALGADADPLAEHPLEVRRAEADAGGDLVERRLLRGAGGDMVDGAADHRVVVGLGLGHGRLSSLSVARKILRAPAGTTRNLRKRLAGPGAHAKGDHARAARLCDDFRDIPAVSRRRARAEGRARPYQRLHPAGRGGALGAGDRPRGEPGDRGAVQGRRHARRRCWRSARRA